MANHTKLVRRLITLGMAREKAVLLVSQAYFLSLHDTELLFDLSGT